MLSYIVQARERGLGVIFITHNVHHAYPAGDRFTILDRGQSYGTFEKAQVSREEVVAMMAGGEEMDTLTAELEEFERSDTDAAQHSGDGSHLAEAFREEVHHEGEEGRRTHEGEAPRS